MIAEEKDAREFMKKHGIIGIAWVSKSGDYNDIILNQVALFMMWEKIGVLRDVLNGVNFEERSRLADGVRKKVKGAELSYLG